VVPVKAVDEGKSLALCDGAKIQHQSSLIMKKANAEFPTSAARISQDLVGVVACEAAADFPLLPLR
jgi:hypothetical protein